MRIERQVLNDTIALDAVADAIIDHSSLYRLATGLQTGVCTSAAMSVVERLRGRVRDVSQPVQIDETSASATTRSLDLVVATNSGSTDVDWVQPSLRAGGILAVLEDPHEPALGVRAKFFRFIRKEPLSANQADACVLKLYQIISSIEANGSSFGVDLSGALYDGVLSGGRFAFPTGKWSLLVGRSGVGKTTLLELIAGLRTSHTAKVIATAGRVFYLPQDAEPITGVTVETNIALFAESREVVDEITTRLHLQTVRARRVDKTLSGGERQRVVVGQALASRADVMLLDEPSAGLDQVRRAQVFHYLGSNSKTQPHTLLCVAHDFTPIVEHFDHVFEIMNGTLVMHA